MSEQLSSFDFHFLNISDAGKYNSRLKAKDRDYRALRYREASHRLLSPFKEGMIQTVGEVIFASNKINRSLNFTVAIAYELHIQGTDLQFLTQDK